MEEANQFSVAVKQHPGSSGLRREVEKGREHYQEMCPTDLSGWVQRGNWRAGGGKMVVDSEVFHLAFLSDTILSRGIY